MTYLIAANTVIVVRDGKQKTIAPGQGEDFTEEEIASIRKANPAGLRAPLNEGGAPAVEAKPAKKAKAARANPAKADEDEDI